MDGQSETNISPTMNNHDHIHQCSISSEVSRVQLTWKYHILGLQWWDFYTSVMVLLYSSQWWTGHCDKCDLFYLIPAVLSISILPAWMLEKIATCSDEHGYKYPRLKSQTWTRISVNAKHQFSCSDCVPSLDMDHFCSVNALLCN